MNEATNKRKCRPPFPSSFRSDGSVITHPVEIANGFCNYFTNVGPKLRRKYLRWTLISTFSWMIRPMSLWLWGWWLLKSWMVSVGPWSLGKPQDMTIFPCMLLIILSKSYQNLFNKNYLFVLFQRNIPGQAKSHQSDSCT